MPGRDIVIDNGDVTSSMETACSVESVELDYSSDACSGILEDAAHYSHSVNNSSDT